MSPRGSIAAFGVPSRVVPTVRQGGYHQAMRTIPHRLLMALLIGALSVATAGCSGAGGDPSDGPGGDTSGGGLAPLADAFDGAWSGVLPCADCDGIDVELSLQREAGAVGRYRLAETYLGAADATGFEIGGEWLEAPCRVGEVAGACIVLVESGQRWFRHLDGSLQAVDAEGRSLDPDGARLQRR